MRKMMNSLLQTSFLLGGMFLCTTTTASGLTQASTGTEVRASKTYHLDTKTGNDNNDGLTAETAWKTLKNVRTTDFQPGDSVLFKRGEHFRGRLEISAQGAAGKPVVFGTYGDAKEKPIFTAVDNSRYAVRICNSNYVTLEGLEIVNHGSKEMGGRTGVLVETRDYGVSKGIRLNDLYVRDVNGIMTKKPSDGTPGGGSGILISNGNSKGGKISTFDGLTIEYCHIKNCYRNAMIWDGCWDRTNWHTNKNVLVRYNLIEQVPGDGIVPIGCDGAILEYNVMRDCADKFDHNSRREAAAGIWPWSCDNTIIRFNEASDHKAPWDGQGFDADYSCSNTIIEYNYSHDNWGGMVLVCAAGDEAKYDYCWGNIKPIVRYNLSIGDGNRPHPARGKMFSPSIHIGGPVDGLNLYRNIVHNKKKAAANIDRSMLISDDWVGCANNTTIKENVFYAPEESGFDLTNSKNNKVEGNYYIGLFKNYLTQKGTLPMSSKHEAIVTNPGEDGLLQFLDSVTIAGGAVCHFVNKEKIEAFFEELVPEPKFAAFAEPYFLAKGAVGALPVAETDELLSKKTVEAAKEYVASVADKTVKFDETQYYRIKNYVRDLAYGNNKRVGYSGCMGNTAHIDWTKEVAEVSCHGASRADASLVWAFEKVGEGGKFKIKNLNSGLYLAATDRSKASNYLTFVEEEAAGVYTIEALNNALGQQHLVCTTGNKNHNQLHASGAGVMNYNAGANDASSWFLIPATELEVKMAAMGNAQYASLYLPFSVSSADNSLKFYGVKGVDAAKNEVTLVEMDGLEASTGALLKGDADVYVLSINGPAETPTFTNLLQGTTLTQELNGNQKYYVLGQNAAGVAGFYAAEDDTFQMNQAYLPLPSATEAEAFHFVFGDLTGIETVTTPCVDAATEVYDLTGRRVQQPTHGVYIQNGKKIFFK